MTTTAPSTDAFEDPQGQDAAAEESRDALTAEADQLTRPDDPDAEPPLRLTVPAGHDLVFSGPDGEILDRPRTEERTRIVTDSSDESSV